MSVVYVCECDGDGVCVFWGGFSSRCTCGSGVMSWWLVDGTGGCWALERASTAHSARAAA